MMMLRVPPLLCVLPLLTAFARRSSGGHRWAHTGHHQQAMCHHANTQAYPHVCTAARTANCRA